MERFAVPLQGNAESVELSAVRLKKEKKKVTTMDRPCWRGKKEKVQKGDWRTKKNDEMETEEVEVKEESKTLLKQMWKVVVAAVVVAVSIVERPYGTVQLVAAGIDEVCHAQTRVPVPQPTAKMERRNIESPKYDRA